MEGDCGRVLRGILYNVIEARDGVDVLALAQKQGTIHLVVSDVVMLRMSGGALAKELVRVRPDTQFRFVSGYLGKTILDHQAVDLEPRARAAFLDTACAGDTELRAAVDGLLRHDAGRDTGSPVPWSPRSPWSPAC